MCVGAPEQALLHATKYRILTARMHVAAERTPVVQSDGTFRQLSPSPPPEAAAPALLALEGGLGEGLGVGGGQVVVAAEEEQYDDLLPWKQRKKKLEQQAHAASLELARFEVSPPSLIAPQAAAPPSPLLCPPPLSLTGCERGSPLHACGERLLPMPPQARQSQPPCLAAFLLLAPC